MANIPGTTGFKPIIGTSQNDRINTRETTGEVRGGDGDDQINGTINETGSFTSDSSLGVKIIYGEGGNDTIIGGSQNDTLDGGTGNDRILSGGGNDVINGGDGDDQINAFVNSDGTVSFYSFGGSLTVTGGAGNDAIRGASGNDNIDGGVGSDDLSGLDGNDTLDGGAGNDKLYGNAGDDKLTGGDGDDELSGNDGNDTLDGGTGNDRILSGGGNDVINGGDGDDQINAFVNSDGTVSYYEYSGGVTVDGGNGNDTIRGTTGNDKLDGGFGADKLYGGAGDDYYVVDNLSDYVQDNQGSNRGLVKIDFYKKPTGVNWTLDAGIKALPYWVDALVQPGLAYSDARKSVAEGKIYYAFPTAVLSTWNAGDRSGFTPLNQAQKDFVQKSLAYIETIINVKFVLVSDASQAGVLTFANNAQTDSGGYAKGSPSSLDWGIFFNNTGVTAAANAAPKDGNFGALTFLHEIGHALGLKHPFEKADSLGTVAESPYLPAAENTVDATVMAYSYEARATYPAAYDDIDIAALQYLYGPAAKPGNSDHQTGDTSYTLSTTSPNFIWDAGGIDTLDASGADKPVVLSLEAGTDVDGKHSFFGSAMNSLITAAGQITINIGTVIENAYGTAYGDLITGNSLANYLFGKAGNDGISGGGGDDQLRGGSGDDTLDGGDGLDIAYYNGEGFTAGITADLQAGTVSGGAGNDKLISIERVWGTEKADTFYGTVGSDYFVGDAGNDYVDGRGGTDRYQINNDLSACTISFDGNTCVIATKDLGTDRLDNIEFVTFVGTSTVSKSIEELRSLAPINRSPTFSASSQSVSVNEDTAKTITLAATDADNDPLTYTAAAAANGTVSVSGSVVTYTPKLNFNGSDSFVVTASDGKGGTATQTVSVAVAAVNDAPAFSASSQSVSATAGMAKTITLAATDVDGDALTYTVATPGKGTATISGSTLTYTPTASASGADSFVVTASDGKGGTATQTVNVTVSGASNAPVISNTSTKAITVAEDGQAQFIIDATDVDSSTLTPSITKAPSNGTISVVDGKNVYTPKRDFQGTDSFEVGVSDGTSTTKYTVNVTVTPVGETVSVDVSSGATVTTYNAAVDTLGIADNFKFTDDSAKSTNAKIINMTAGDIIEVTGASSDHSFTSVGNDILISYNNAKAGVLNQYTLVGLASKGGAVVDEATAEAVAGFDFFNSLTKSNRSPTFSASSQTVSATAGTAKTIALAATDLDGDALTYSVAAPGKGTATISGNMLTYTPMASATGSDSFVVTASDGKGGTATQTIAATIAASSTSASSAVDFRMSTSDGWTGTVGGNGQIFGSSGFQDIKVSSGTLTLDASFNRGGDIIRLPEAASSYSIVRTGSSAQISNAGLTTIIPVGTTGLATIFADGVRKLIFADGSLKIGSQAFSASASITAGTDNSTVPTGTDSAATARISLSGNDLAAAQTAHVTIGGTATLFGTSSNDVVALAAGAKSNLTFDASFNRGGDTIILGKDAGSFSAVRSGSSIVLTATDQTLTIPVGTAGLTLKFTDGNRSLAFTGGVFKIGDQTIEQTSTALTSATVTISLDVGTDASRAALSGSNGAIVFTDNAAVAGNVRITGFGADDVIRVTGATESKYSFTSGDLDKDGSADDLSMVFNAGSGVVNIIEILNVVSPSDFIFDKASAVKAVGFNFVTFG